MQKQTFKQNNNMFDILISWMLFGLMLFIAVYAAHDLGQNLGRNYEYLIEINQ